MNKRHLVPLMGAFVGSVLLLTGVAAMDGGHLGNDQATATSAHAAVPPERGEQPLSAVAPQTPESRLLAVEAEAATDPIGPHRDEIPDVAGRSAVLELRVRRGAVVVGARATFLTGPNAGSSFDLAASEASAWRGLFPGHGLLAIDAGSPCVREVVLVHGRPTALEIDLAGGWAFEARVALEGETPVELATVEVDGLRYTPRPDGVVSGTTAAAGPARLVVQAPGHVPYCEIIQPERPRLADVALVRGRSIRLKIQPPTGALVNEEIFVRVVSRRPARLAGVPPRDAFPWEVVGPIRTRVDGTVRVDGLPAGRIEFHASSLSCTGATHFHSTPVGELQVPSASTGTGEELPELRLQLERRPVAEVLVQRDGEPLRDAVLQVHHRRPLVHLLKSLEKDAPRLLRRRPFALDPACVRRAVTDARGIASIPLLAGPLDHDIFVLEPDGTGERFVLEPPSSDGGDQICLHCPPSPASLALPAAPSRVR